MNNRGRLKTKGPGKKYKMEQVWNLKDYLAADIASGVRQLLYAKKCGYPADITPEEWDEILKEIVWTFEQISKDYDGSPYNQAFSKYFDESVESKDVNSWFKREPATREDGSVIEGYSQVTFVGSEFVQSEENKKEDEEYYNRIEAGKQLFVKWFDHLWD